MSNQSQPRFAVTQGANYRENYANSVQVRVSVWDIFLLFGLAHPSAPDEVTIENQQGIYLSPQQAKALFNVLGQNLSQYEQTFGPIALEPLGSGDEGQVQ
jgi:flagellar protein FlaG